MRTNDDWPDVSGLDAKSVLCMAAAISLDIAAEDVERVVEVLNGQLERVALWKSCGLLGEEPAVVFEAAWT